MSARAADLASSISKISAELRRMEALISSLAAELDPRVVREFTVTVDHARQTAWTVQQFLETSKPHRDIYNLLADLEARRIKSSTNIVQELALDADSQSLNITTAGVTELAKAVEQLHRRLSTVVKPSVVRAELSDDIVR
jgi:cysteinyl-tRNA synthetase